MSDETEITVECSTCGRNGNPPEECEKCHGKAPIQPRQFTLSEIRSGRAPKDDRYGGRSSTDAVGPKIINLPGSGS